MQAQYCKNLKSWEKLSTDFPFNKLHQFTAMLMFTKCIAMDQCYAHSKRTLSIDFNRKTSSLNCRKFAEFL